MYKIIYKIGNKILPGPASHCLIPSQTLCPAAALTTSDPTIVATAVPALPLVKPFASQICFSGYSMQFHHFKLFHDYDFYMIRSWERQRQSWAAEKNTEW